jgi:acetoin utilization protein AcuB
MAAVREARALGLEDVMTASPWFCHADDTLAHAVAVMEQQAIRHLPVTEDGALVGVVSQRDAALVLSSAAPGRRAELLVRDALARDPYVVDVGAPLDEVLLAMAERHIGSALVTRGGRLAGILTATDACRAFGETLRQLRSG